MKRWVYNSNLFSAFRLVFFRRGFRSLDLRLFLSSHWQLLRLVLSCFFDLSPSIWDLVNLFRCSTCLRLGSPRLFQKVITSWPSGTWWIAIMLNGIEGPVRPSWPPQRLIIINWYSCVQNLLNLRRFWMLSRKKCSESQIFFISFRDLGSPFEHVCATGKCRTLNDANTPHTSFLNQIHWQLKLFKKDPHHLPSVAHHMRSTQTQSLVSHGYSAQHQSYENSNSRRKSNKPRIPNQICRSRISSARSRKKQFS